MPDTLIELTCNAEWVSHVAHSRHEAEAYALEANRWWAGSRQMPCPFDEYVPESAFAVEFEATQSAHGRWTVYVDCAWALSEHKTLKSALAMADHLYDADGVSESEMEILVFGQEYELTEDPNARPLTFMELELVVYKGTSEGLTSYLIGGVKGELTTEEEFVPASELQGLE